MSASLRLTLAVRNTDAIVDGMVPQFDVDWRTVTIGRSPTTDWVLPDSDSLISSRHCEISYAEGSYQLADRSTNGTFLNGAPSRMSGPHILQDGDHFRIGHYEIVARIERAVAAPPIVLPTARPASPPTAPIAVLPVAPPPPPPAPASPPAAAPAAAAVPAADSGPSSGDVWGKHSNSYSVDWVRGGFAAAAAPPPAPSAALTQRNALIPNAAPFAPVGDAAAQLEAARVAEHALAQFFAAAGLDAALLKNQESEVMSAAGQLLRRLIGGLVVMLEARARAKSQMGTQTTIFTREGNNPIKFARSPESALAQLLKPPISGYMSAERAVEDGFRDLQLHQMATLTAMQGALRATLNRFSPTAIRQRAESKGILARIMPNAREAALWKAYEREFSGVAQGSDEAFMDVFAKEVRRAYEEQAAKLNSAPAPKP